MRVSTKTVLICTLALSTLTLTACGGEMSGESAASRLQLQNQYLSVGDGNSSSSIGVVTAPTLQLVATLAPPVVNNVTLQANDIILSGTSAYVAYNVAGSGTGGGVDVVNVAVPTIPVLGSSTTYADSDINGIYVWGQNLYAAGQNLAAPAILNNYSLSLLGSVSGLTSQSTLPSYAGVQVTGDLLGQYLYVVSGDSAAGGLTVLNRSSLTQVGFSALTDARAVGVSLFNNYAYVVSGQPGKLTAYTATGIPGGSVTLGGASIPQSKSTVQVGLHYAVATTGETGTSIVCLDTMAIAGTQAPPVVTSGTSVTNAAILVNGLLITANGDQGVNMYSVATGSLLPSTSSCNNLTISFIGKINFNTAVSANSLKYLAGLLFVGAGSGGYQIVSVTSLPLSTGLLTTL